MLDYWDIGLAYWDMDLNKACKIYVSKQNDKWNSQKVDV